jgi:hypothetical protein
MACCSSAQDPHIACQHPLLLLLLAVLLLAACCSYRQTDRTAETNQRGCLLTPLQCSPAIVNLEVQPSAEKALPAAAAVGAQSCCHWRDPCRLPRARPAWALLPSTDGSSSLLQAYYPLSGVQAVQQLQHFEGSAGNAIGARGSCCAGRADATAAAAAVFWGCGRPQYPPASTTEEVAVANALGWGGLGQRIWVFGFCCCFCCCWPRGR